MAEQAAAAYQQVMRLMGQPPEAVAAAAGAFAAGGLDGLYRWEIEQLMQSPAPRPGFMAAAYAMLGETDLAFEWLDRSVDSYDSWSFQLNDPLWDLLREDPRYEELLRRLNLSG
jgi:hypothetical protein